MEQILLEHLAAQKGPVMVGTLAKRFLISQSRMVRALNTLINEGKVEVVTIGKHKFYKAKE
jgi:DNA-binding IclR family transcriptional regulator